MATSQFIRFFEEIGIDDVPLVGGKNASLGEMYRNGLGENVVQGAVDPDELYVRKPTFP